MFNELHSNQIIINESILPSVDSTLENPSNICIGSENKRFNKVFTNDLEISTNSINFYDDNGNFINTISIDNITNGNLFEPGDQVIATLPFTYKVLVNDFVGNPQTLISTSNVFGVVIQT